MKRILVALIFLSNSIIVEISACSCENVANMFSENIKANHIIFMGTVLEQIQIPRDSNYFLLYHGLTKIQVNKWYQNKMTSDTIFYANGDGGLCASSLEYLKLGEQVIIKAVKASIYISPIDFSPNQNKDIIHFIHTYKNMPTVGYSICDVSILEVKNQLVIGNITKNFQNRKWNEINFIRRISEKWAKKLEEKLIGRKTKYQSWKLNKFARFMNEKWNSL